VLNAAIQAAPLLQQAYTPDGLLAGLTDASNHATSFAYDTLNRLTTKTPPSPAPVVSYRYDLNGPLLRDDERFVAGAKRAGQIARLP
jgi:YD repeat-containing protein